MRSVSANFALPEALAPANKNHTVVSNKSFAGGKAIRVIDSASDSNV